MSETWLRVFLRDLHVIRVRCKGEKCGAILECSIDEIDRFFKDFKCVACGASFARDKFTDDYLLKLKTAMSGLQNLSDKIDVEFVVSEPASK